MKDYSESNSSNMSDDVRAIAASICKAKNRFKATGLESLNPHFKSKYAKLAAIYDAVEGALGEEDIIIVHYRVYHEKGLLLSTRLIHTPTGQWILDIVPVENEKPGAQGQGSALTYMKRYAVLNLCAIPQDEGDDDGEEERKYIEENDHLINQEQYEDLMIALGDCLEPKKVRDAIFWKNKVDHFENLRMSQYKGAMGYIKNQPKKAQ